MLNTLTPRAAVVIAALVLGLAAMPTSAQIGETALFLQRFPRNFDRTELEQDVVFQNEAGEVQAGVKCATRSVGDFERTMIEAAVGDMVEIQGHAQRFSGLTVPIVFHVATTSAGVGNLTKKDIKRQIRVLKKAYVSHGIRFRLQGIRRYQDDEFATGCADEDIEKKFKARNAVDPANTLNVYTCIPSNGYLGWAFFPWELPEDSFMHGVVLHHSTLPRGSAAPYNLGKTLTHEIGHYLGLYHTFQGSCSDGDLVADTPAEQGPAYGCPVPRDTCSAPGQDSVRNFMNYTDDSCMKQFTPGQGERMLDLVATFRPSLQSS